MKNRKRILLKTGLVLAFVAGGLNGCGKEPRTVAAAPETVSDVPVFVVQKTSVPDLLDVVGTVRAAQTSQLSAQTMGTIVAVQVHEGERVQAGELLASMDDAEQRAVVDQATAAQLAATKEVSADESEDALAEGTLKRYQQLYDKKSVSPQEFDEIKTSWQSASARLEMARARLAQAKAALAQARTSLGFTRIRAPFDGLVTERKVDPGTLASPGLPILTVEDTRSYRLEVTVDEDEVHLVRVGQTAPAHIDALGSDSLLGKVVQIIPAADPGSRSVLVKIELPRNTQTRSGLFGRAQFARGERSALLIPRTAVVERGQLHGAYVLDSNQIVSLRYLTLGRFTASQVEVLAGLEPGEKLVALPGEHDLAGKRISAQP